MTEVLGINTTNYADIEDVIRDIWDLKKLFDRVSGNKVKPLNFNKLLRSQEYRDQVLLKLSRVKHQEISSLAKKLKSLKLSGSVHIDDIRQETQSPVINTDAADATNKITALINENTKIKEHYQRQSTLLERWKWVSYSAAGLLAISLITLAYPVVYQFYTNKTIEITGSILKDTVFSSAKNYVLKTPVFVEGNATLTIEPGTIITGESGAALIITRNAKLIAKGTKELPIVFTSNRPLGQRKRGDWGGLVLLGNAPVNRKGQLEGIDQYDVRGAFGGDDVSANCGILEYARIEFAGYETFVDNELNGLTLGGCGKETIIRHVQVHKPLDDGIEVFGGTVDLKHIVVTGAADDAFDWDMGWQGRVQFLVVQMHGDKGDNAFEGDNYKKDPDILPRSNPVFYNVTLIGANSQQIAHRAMTIRRGSGGKFGNILMVGFSKDSIDLRGNNVAGLIKDKQLSFSNMMMYQINDGDYFPDESGTLNDDSSFSESEYFSQAALNNRFGLDPRLPAAIYNSFQPEFTPLAHSPARHSTAIIPQGEFWDEGADYIGAIRPGSASSWLDGWVLFPTS